MLGRTERVKELPWQMLKRALRFPNHASRSDGRISTKPSFFSEQPEKRGMRWNDFDRQEARDNLDLLTTAAKTPLDEVTTATLEDGL